MGKLALPGYSLSSLRKLGRGLRDPHFESEEQEEIIWKYVTTPMVNCFVSAS